MRQLLLFLCLPLCLSACKAFIPSTIIPYSMVKYQEGKYIDQTEITIEQWAEFVYDGNETRKPNPEFSAKYKYHQVFYPKSKPDSLFRAFGKIDYYQLPVPFEYFDTLNYQELREILDFPITGIKHEDAKAYCKWRTEKYNKKNNIHSKKRITFHLPDSILYLKEDASKPNYITTGNIQKVYNATKDDSQLYGVLSNAFEMTSANKKYPKNHSKLTYKELEALTSFRCEGVIDKR